MGCPHKENMRGRRPVMSPMLTPNENDLNYRPTGNHQKDPEAS